MAQLILIRHGQSVANAERRLTWGPHEPLSARGRDEARERAAQLRDRFDPVALYASPFVRALETARLIGRVLGLEPEVVADLREQDFGALRGQSYRSLPTREMAEADRWHFRPDGGETLADVSRRAGPALDTIARRHLGGQVVIVSHGGVLAALQAWTAGRFESGPAIARNAAGYVLQRRGRGWEGPYPLEEP